MNSKTTSLIALIPLALIGLVIAFGLGYVYHLAHYWNPLIIVSIAFPFVFALLLATLAAKVVAISGCELVFVGAIVGLAIGIAGIGGKFWIPYQMEISNAATKMIETGEADDFSHSEIKELLRSQTTLSGYMSHRAEAGFGIVRRGRSLPVGGAFMWGLWGIEALIICLFATCGGIGGKEIFP